MGRQTYSSRGQVYESTGGVFARRHGRVWIDNFERDTLAYSSLYAETGELRENSRYTGTKGYYSPSGRTTEVWQNPTADGSPLDETRQAWPEPGDEFCYVTRLRSISGQWQTWYLWGGRNRYPRYQAEFISDGTFRVQVRRDDGSRYTLATTIGAGAVNWSSYIGTWLVVAVRWLSTDEGDEKDGVRAMVGRASEFPFQEFSWQGYDDGDVDFSPIAEIESPYAGNPDGSSDVPQERGKIGFRSSVNCSMDLDDIELLSATSPVVVPTWPAPGDQPELGSRITTPADNATQSGPSQPAGVRVNVKNNLTGFRLRLSQNTRDVTRAYIKQPAGEPVVASEDISDLQAGDSVDIRATLAPGESYDLLLDAEGSEYVRGRYESSGQYPYTSSDFDIVDGVYSQGGSTSDWIRYCIDRVTALR